MNYGVYAPNSGRVVNAQLKVLIADITLTSSGSFEQIPIPAGFDHLELLVSLRSTVSAAGDVAYMFFNGDTTAANYSTQIFYGNASSAASVRADTPRPTQVTGATAPAGAYGTAKISIQNHSRNGLKAALGVSQNRQSATDQYAVLFAMEWESTEPITNITIRTDNHATDLFAAGSRVQVFGLGTFAVALAR